MWTAPSWQGQSSLRSADRCSQISASSRALDRKSLISTHASNLRKSIIGHEQPSNDTLFLANAGDGSVRLFRGADYAQSGSIDLGEDADNIRVDAASNRVFV